MTEINELVAPPQPHSPGDDVECPFCPAPKPEDFKHRQRPSGAKPKPDPIFHHDKWGPPGHWKYFISRVALNFHRTVCEHKPR